MPEPPRHTAVIADDHAIVRSALRTILDGIGRVEILAEASDGMQAIAMARAHRPTLLTLDAGMPAVRGMEAYGEIRRWSPGTRIAVITGLGARAALAEWLAAGVDGLFLKSAAPDELARGLARILSGQRHVSPEVATLLRDHPAPAPLSLRERQVLHLIAGGASNTEVAARLSISPKTVDNHRTRLMAKLGVHSLGELLAYALREGLLES